MTITEQRLIELFRTGTTAELNDAIAKLTEQRGKYESERVYARALKAYDRETEQKYDPDTATARQVVEHWRTTASDLKERQDKLAWTLVEAFADQVLRAMDRES